VESVIFPKAILCMKQTEKILPDVFIISIDNPFLVVQNANKCINAKI